MSPWKAAERAGADDVATWRADPTALSRLPLGEFEEGPLLQVVARRILLAARLPPGLIALLVGRREGARGLLELTSYWRGVRRALRDRDTWLKLTQGTTILVYHAVGADGEKPSRFIVPRRSFERQMRTLARRCPVLTLDDLVALHRTHRLPPARSVVITFDDGYEDTRKLAAPVLARLRLPATLFLVSTRVGEGMVWQGDGELARRPLVSWEDVDALRQRGLEIGAHTRTHPILTELPEDELDPEIAGSRTDLAERLGAPPSAFAYPYGKWNVATAEAARRAGFTSALTVSAGRNGPATPLHALRRTLVYGSDSRLRFRLGLAFGDTTILDRLRQRLRGSRRA
jgi:peptidoglycan/xylan/chitin deacetylase (PgdA/CDA1 family)